MTKGEYTTKVKPAHNKTWRDAKALYVEVNLKFQGEEKLFYGFIDLNEVEK